MSSGPIFDSWEWTPEAAPQVYFAFWLERWSRLYDAQLREAAFIENMRIRQDSMRRSALGWRS